MFLRLREEEFTCRVLAAAGVEALVRSFETFYEKKRGVTSLELLCQEITKEEMAKRQRKEMKKLKKKRKKERKGDGRECCEVSYFIFLEHPNFVLSMNTMYDTEGTPLSEFPDVFGRLS